MYGAGPVSYTHLICETEEDALVIHSPVSQERVAYIKNAYGIKVQAKEILLSPSEREIVQ